MENVIQMMIIKKLVMVILIASALISTSLGAARRSGTHVSASALMNGDGEGALGMTRTTQELPGLRSHDLDDGGELEEANNKDREFMMEEAVHERMLMRMNTHDYGRYNPTPSLRRPRYRRIPN